MNGIEVHSQQTNAQSRKKINELNFNIIYPYLQVDDGDKVLDVGCGDGDFTELLGKELSLRSVYGVDKDKSLLKKARKRGLRIKQADIEKRIPFPEDFFEFIICRQVVEHLNNPDSFLDECLRVLKKGGILVVTTPNLASWFNRILFLFGVQPFSMETSTIDKTVGLKFTRKLTPMREPLGHLRVFTKGALEDIMQLHRFKVVKVLGCQVFYLPKFMAPFDYFFSFFSSLSSDLVIIAKK